MEFGGQGKKSAANADGKWMVTLDPLVAADRRIKKECGFAPLADVNATPRLNSSLGIGSLFNGMIHPVIPYGIRGVV